MNALLIYPEFPDTFWSFSSRSEIHREEICLSAAGTVDDLVDAAEVPGTGGWWT